MDLKIGFKNINEQYIDALDFTNKALTKISNDKQCSIDEAKSYLTLTGIVWEEFYDPSLSFLLIIFYSNF